MQQQEKKIHSNQAHLPASSWVSYHHGGKANHFLTYPVYLLFIVTHGIFLSPPPPRCCWYTYTGHFVMKKDSFAFSHLSLPLPTPSVRFCQWGFSPLWIPPLLTGLQFVVAGVIWSVTLMKVIWSAMDVQVNIVPLLSLENVCVRNNKRWGIPHILWDIAKIPVPQFDVQIPSWSTPVRKAITCNCLRDFRWLKKNPKTEVIFIANYFIT